MAVNGLASGECRGNRKDGVTPAFCAYGGDAGLQVTRGSRCTRFEQGWLDSHAEVEVDGKPENARLLRETDDRWLREATAGSKQPVYGSRWEQVLDDPLVARW